jgi:uncharacterized membrane protein
VPVAPPRQIGGGQMDFGFAAFEAPLPLPVTPQDLRQYEEIVPGITKDFIIPHAIREQKARHEAVLAEVESNAFAMRWGLVCGILVAVGFLVAGVIVALNVSPWAGVAMVGWPMVSTVGILVVRQVRGQRQAEPKQRPPQTS